MLASADGYMGKFIMKGSRKVETPTTLASEGAEVVVSALTQEIFDVWPQEALAEAARAVVEERKV